MFCKFCNAELDDGTTVCPECGKDLQVTEEVTEEKVGTPLQTPEMSAPAKSEPVKQEKQKVNIWMYIAITACCALGVLLGFMIWQGMRPDADTETTAATDPIVTTDPVAVTTPTGNGQEAPTPEELGITTEGFMDRTAYSADEATAMANADKVVATVGKYTLTNSQLQVYYWRSFSSFVSDVLESGSDLVNEYGLDISKPLNEQYVLGSEVTWEKYFLHQGLSIWWQYACLNTMADEAGYQLDEATVQDLATTETELEAQAEKDGFANGEALVKARLGAMCDVADFLVYTEMTTRGDKYSEYYQKNYVPTEQEVSDFYDLNIDYYTYYGITKEAGKLAAVRHILLQPGEVDASTGLPNATEEQWEECRVKAEELYGQWQAGEATEESFGELAKTNSADGSAPNGGLYDSVYKGQMVANFDSWVFDSARKPGDHGIVKTEFGYHIMYFVSLSEQDAWYATAYKDAIDYAYGYSNALGAKMEANKLQPDLEKIFVMDLAQDLDTENSTDTTQPTTAE